MSERFLYLGLLRSCERFPDRPALSLGGDEYSYAEMFEAGRRIATTIRRYVPEGAARLTGILAYRTLPAYYGVWGATLAGHGFVPLNCNFPPQRSRLMLQGAGCSALIVDAPSEPQLAEILDGSDEPKLLLFPARDDTASLQKEWPSHIAIGADQFEPAAAWSMPNGSPDDVAYIIFTSGSTGTPKGVVVAHRNVGPYLDYIIENYEVTEADRISHMFDMTFDASVSDMFVPWEVGACCCCPTPKSMISPGRYIKDQAISLWFSVPSTIAFMKRLRMLKPGSYPSLRITLFGGEALPIESMQTWHEAAPNSALYNLYGPTELTIACSAHQWDPANPEDGSEHGVVPIGHVFPWMKALVVDEDLIEVAVGETGELLVAGGPQTTLGYLNDPERTAAQFLKPPGHNEIYYRTGDRVRRTEGGAPFAHLGRVDQQIKVSGHRIELGEIEAAIRRSSEYDVVVALGWPVSLRGADGIAAFVEGKRPDNDRSLHDALAAQLPDYMVPKQWHFWERLPLNPNGKIDRNAILERLKKGQ